MIKFKNNKYRKIIFKRNLVIKKFQKPNISNSVKEINGYNYFLNKNIFKLIKRFKIIKKKNITQIYYKRYNQKNLSSFFKVSKFYNISNIKFKKINSTNYIKNISKNLKKNMNNENMNYILKIDHLIKKFKNQTLLIAPAHFDFIHYNTLVAEDGYYTIDFEFFKMKKIFNYDLFNWYFTPLLTNIIRYNLNVFSNRLIDICFIFLKIINYGYSHKLNSDFFKKKYLFFFFLEKYFFLISEKNKIKKDTREYLKLGKLESLIIKKLQNFNL